MHFVNCGNIENLPRSERPNLLTERDTRKLLRQVESNISMPLCPISQIRLIRAQGKACFKAYCSAYIVQVGLPQTDCTQSHEFALQTGEVG